jgi:hypothetical protein
MVTPSATGSEKGIPNSTISQPLEARMGTTFRVASMLGKQIAKFTAYATIIVAVITGVVGYLLLAQLW